MRLIDADALMENFNGINLNECVKYGNVNEYQRHISYSTMMMYEVADAIQDAPTVELPKSDHITNNDGYGHLIIDLNNHSAECSACGDHWETNPDFMSVKMAVEDDFFYCPSCGVRMAEKEVIK